MSQEKIIKTLEKKGRLFATQIIQELQIDDEPKEFIRRVLKQMRKYHEVGYILVGIHGERHDKLFDIEDSKGKRSIIKEASLYKKFPELINKRITRSCYLYFIS